MSDDLIKSIQDLIDSGRGDAGRNKYILSRLKAGKSLYKSDQQYIEKHLSKPIKGIKIPESTWSVQQKEQEEKRKAEIAGLKTEVTIHEERLDDIAKKKKETALKYKPPGNMGASLAAFYAGVISVATITLFSKSKIFSIIPISEPENFNQYTIEVAIGIIIIYTIAVYSRSIMTLVLQPSGTMSVGAVDKQDEFSDNRKKYTLAKLHSELEMLKLYVEKINILATCLNKYPSSETDIRNEIDEAQNQKTQVIDQLESEINLSSDAIESDVSSEVLRICKLAKDNMFEKQPNDIWVHHMDISEIVTAIDNLKK